MNPTGFIAWYPSMIYATSPFFSFIFPYHADKLSLSLFADETARVLKITVQNLSLKIRKFHFKYIMENNDNLENLIWNKIFLFIVIVIGMII